MSGDQLFVVAIFTQLVVLIGIFYQVRQTHKLVNSRMTELVDLTRKSALAEGKEEERLKDA